MACEGKDPDCKACGGTGEIEIPHCPSKLVDEDTADLLALVAQMEEGFPPVAGGVIDQTDWFLSVCKRVRREEQRCEAEKAERGAKDA